MVFLSKKGYKNKTVKKTKMIAGSKVKKTKRLRIRPGEPIIITTKPKPRFNEKLIELLERLAKLMTQKGDHIRSRAYSKAQETVMMFNGDITDVEQMKGKPNIGPTILEKFKEYLETGTLRLFEREKDNPEYILSEVYGIGPKKAKDLVEKGITSIAQLRAREDELLNASQKAGLKYYEDILERIPRKEIDEYNMIFQKAFDDVKVPGAEYEIVGSYRRGAQTSGDIDAIITSPDPETFTKFIEKLRNHETGNNIILVTLSYGKTKCLVITKLPGHKNARRVDFMYTSPQEYPFAVLYFTGSKAFNTMMRGHALKMGTSLNEHGLYKKESGKAKEEKVEHAFGSERDVFDYLGLEYKSPEERIDGRSIIVTEKPMKSEAKKEAKSEEPIEEKIEEPKENIRLEPEPIVTDAPSVVTVIPQEEPKQKPKKRITLKIKIKPEKIDIKHSEQIKLAPNSNTMANKHIESFKPTKNANPLRSEDGLNSSGSMTAKEINPSPEGAYLNLQRFKTTGIDVLTSLTEKELGDMLIAANDAYYNTKTTLMTDNEYDIVKEYIQMKYPKNAAVAQVGAPIQGKNKVTLPYNMPSMDKIKPDTNALTTWKAKYTGPYVLSCKLDGVSGMFDSETKKLYTRGDGKVGQDISHLITRLGLNEKVDVKTPVVVRGEFIIPRRVFDDKYKETFANPRNLVSGIINTKGADEKVNDLHFVAYEIIHPQMKPSKQMETLTKLGYEVVQYKETPVSNLTNENLSETLMDWRTKYMYEIDGVIVADDNMHPRKDGNPEYAFAFKMVISDQIAEAKVVDVIWTPSKSGYLKPRVRIEPIKLGGVTIEYATGFNGSYIETNKIGIGAVIQIIRSGDVIPHIKSVTTPAERAKMPTEPYHWTDTHIDVILDSSDDNVTVREKNITAFFVGIEVDGLSKGNVARIMTAGFDTVSKILKMTKTDFAKVEGFKEKTIEKIYSGIQDKVKAASLLTIMSSSNLLGRGIGERKIKPILEEFPDILTRNDGSKEKIALLLGIKGIGKENANSFVENIPKFLAFIKECGLEYKLTNAPMENKMEITVAKQTVDTSHPLYQKHIVMTKVRDAKIIDALAQIGGILDNSMSKSTFVLIVKSKEDKSNKTEYAEKHNIPVMTPEEFIKKYLN